MGSKMELAIGTCAGCLVVPFPIYSSGSPSLIGTILQKILAFIIPLLIIVGWIIGHDLALFFANLETISLFVSVLLVNVLIQNGKSNYMEG